MITDETKIEQMTLENFASWAVDEARDHPGFQCDIYEAYNAATKDATGCWRVLTSTIADSDYIIFAYYGGGNTAAMYEIAYDPEKAKEYVKAFLYDNDFSSVILNARTIAYKTYAETKWCPQDVIEAAAEDGVSLTEQQAAVWWEQNERSFREVLVQTGNEILTAINWQIIAAGNKKE